MVLLYFRYHEQEQVQGPPVFLRFDDKSTRSESHEEDKLTPVQDLWETVCNNLTKHYFPSSNISVDEQLVPFRGG